MAQKPNSCSGCSLESTGTGFYEASGPEYSDLLIIGDSPEDDNYKLKSLLKRSLGLDKDLIRKHSILSCQPRDKQYMRMAYMPKAIYSCGQYYKKTLQEPHKVVVSAGYLATKTLLGLQKLKLENFHGQPTEVNGSIIVPTFSSTTLAEGKQKLTGVVCFDLLRARSLADGSFKPEPAILRVDPDIGWLTRWVDTFLEQLANGLDLWLAIDIETIGKLKESEEALKEGNDPIIRINFSCNPDEGITFPWVGEYIEQAKRLFACKAWKWFWNKRFDLTILRKGGFHVAEPIHDGMNAGKMLNSDIPLGLGFWAPFYSRYIHPVYRTGAWKHLSDSSPGEYAAIDAFQTLRIAYGLKRDLLKSGQWDSYMRHIYELDTIVLHPAEDVGLYIDREKLIAFKDQLTEKEKILKAKIQSQVGEDHRPWEGMRKTPKEGFVEREIELDVFWCSDCNEEVGEKHKCPVLKPPKEAKKPRAKRKTKNSIDNPLPDLGLSAGDVTSPSVSGEDRVGGSLSDLEGSRAEEGRQAKFDFK